MSKRFVVLDSFRGLFALSIVLVHLYVIDSFGKTPFFRGGGLFVEFFFLLSGFVITHSYGYRDSLNFRSFAISRTFRIFPLHVAMLLFFFLIETAKLIAYKNGIHFNVLPFTEACAVKEIIPNLFLVHSWSRLTQVNSFDYSSWSISIEYYMYMIFFFSTTLFKRKKELVWCILSVSALVLYMTHSELVVVQVKRGISGFFLGAVIYQIYKKIDTYTPSFFYASIAELIAAVSVIIVVCINSSEIFPITLLVFGGTIIIFTFEAGCISNLLQKGLFRTIGERSYSIYLVHLAIIYILTFSCIIFQKVTGKEITVMVGMKRYIDLGNPVFNNLLVLAVLAVTITVSGFTFK